jgi:hypothetical protein
MLCIVVGLGNRLERTVWIVRRLEAHASTGVRKGAQACAREHRRAQGSTGVRKGAQACAREQRRAQGAGVRWRHRRAQGAGVR